MSTTIAGYALLGWHYSGREIPDIRAELLSNGVRKGTVSKVATVLAALAAGIISPADVTSLSQSYTLVTEGSPVDRVAKAIAKLTPAERRRVLRKLTKEVSGNL